MTNRLKLKSSLPCCDKGKIIEKMNLISDIRHPTLAPHLSISPGNKLSSMKFLQQACAVEML